MLDHFRFKLEETAAKSGDERVKNNAAMMLASIDEEQKKLAIGMMQTAAKEHVQGEAQLLQARRQGAAMQAQQMQAVQLPPVPPGFVATRPLQKGEPEEIRKITDTTGAIINAYDAIIAKMESPERGLKYAAELDELYDDLILATKMKYPRGVTIDAIKDMTPKPPLTGLGYALDRYKISREREIDGYLKEMETRGVVPSGQYSPGAVIEPVPPEGAVAK